MRITLAIIPLLLLLLGTSARSMIPSDEIIDSTSVRPLRHDTVALYFIDGSIVTGTLHSESADGLTIISTITGRAKGYSRDEIAHVAPHPMVLVETIDGREIYGRIIVRNDEKTSLEIEQIGKLEIDNERILSMHPTDDPPRRLRVQKRTFTSRADSSSVVRSPHETRQFAQLNGFGLRSGEAFYQNAQIIGNMVVVGATENVSFIAGFIPLFLFGIDSDGTPAWFGIKLSAPIGADHLNIGFSGQVTTVLGETSSTAGLLAGVITIGDRRNNLSFGATSIPTSFADEPPALSLSTTASINDRWSVISENYVQLSERNDIPGILSLGLRHFGTDFSIDLAIVGAFELEGNGLIGVLPWLSVGVPL